MIVALTPGYCLAQMEAEHHDIFQFGAQAIGVLTHESPAIHGTDLTEGYLTQPVAMAGLDPWNEKLSFKLTLNFGEPPSSAASSTPVSTAKDTSTAATPTRTCTSW